MQRHLPAVAAHADEEINMTPMLDVVFILLIFFVVTASFVAESGIVADRSQAPPDPSNSRPGAILVEILPGDEIRINGRTVDFRAVRANLEQLRAVNPDHPLLVQAASASTTQALVSVLDAAELAEIASVSVGPL